MKPSRCLSAVMLCASVVTLAMTPGCQTQHRADKAPLDPPGSAKGSAKTGATPMTHKSALPRRQYDNLYLKLAAGGVDMSELRLALTDPDVTALTKTTHALPAMAWHRSALYLMQDLWRLKREKYPELNWDLLEKPPVRIALASTLHRLQKEDGTREYVDYINRFRDDPDPFNQLQVVMAMGYMNDSDNIDYLASKLDSDSSLVVKNAISALASLDDEAARNIVVELGDTHSDETLRAFIQQVLEATRR